MKYKILRNFVTKETANFLYEYLEFSTKVFIADGNNLAQNGDTTVPGCLGPRNNDLTFDSFLKFMHKKVEKESQKSLFPTYAYARLYRTGNIMAKHFDRPACEYSVTLKLGDSENGNWPISIDNDDILLDDGDAVLYKGCEVAHWRNKCEIQDYKLGQVFLHYVDANGPYSKEKYDKMHDKADFFEKNIEFFLE